MIPPLNIDVVISLMTREIFLRCFTGNGFVGFLVINNFFLNLYINTYNLDNYVSFCCFMLPINNDKIGHNGSIQICTQFDASSTYRL